MQVGRNSFQDDHGLRIGERARLALGGGTMELTAAYDAQGQAHAKRASSVAPPHRLPIALPKGATLARMWREPISGAYQLLGAPHLLFSRLDWERHRGKQFASHCTNPYRRGIATRVEFRRWVSV